MKNYISPQTTNVNIALMTVLMVSNNAGLDYDPNTGIDPEEVF